MSGSIVKRTLFLVALASVAVGVAWHAGSADDTLAASADDIVASCEESEHRSTCYEERVPELLDEIGVEGVFHVIREIRKRDSNYQFCHVLAHEIGAREVAKDPNNWLDAVTQNPQDGLCSNGFIHGAALERFNKEVFTEQELQEGVIPELALACEPRAGWRPTELDKAICYHGLGHLSVHLTQADIPAALTVCDEVVRRVEGNFTRVCQEGVFMQLFQPLEPEDYALIESLPVQPTKQNLDMFCNGFGEGANAACWREGWPFYREEILTADGMEWFCSRETNPRLQDACFDTAIAILGRSSLNNPERSAGVCNALPHERQVRCFSKVALTFAEEDRTRGARAVNFCGRAGDDSVSKRCYDFLSNVSTFVYHPDDPNRLALCDALPEEFAASCVARGEQ